MKKLFVHIGMPKCGSTTLQEFCAANRDALQAKGCLYPVALNGWPQHAELTLSYHRDMEGNNTPCLPQDYYTQCCKNTECHTLCLSSEFFGANPISTCDFLSRKYNTTYIVYFRSPLAFAQSFLLQGTASYFCDIFAEWPELLATQRIIDYVSQQLIFLDLFCGGDLSVANFVVKNFDMCIKNGRFEEDFCATLGITDMQSLNKIPQQNVGLNIDYAFFLAHCSPLPLTQSVKWQILFELCALSAADSHARKYRLFSKKQIASIPQDIIDRYTELGNRMGDAEFWQRSVDTMLKLEECPYRQLSEDKQWEIFEKLSPACQQSIREVWPHQGDFPGMLRRTGFLPDIPEDAKTAYLIRRWSMAYGQLALRQDSQQAKLEECDRTKQNLEAPLQELQSICGEDQQAEATIDALREEINALRHSKSWLVTAPLRKINDLLKS